MARTNHTATLVLVALALVAGMMVLPYNAYAVVTIGQPAPAFKITTTSGQVVTLENYRGQVLVIDFFATWCQPCRQSIPHLVELNRKYGKQGLHVLGLSADEDGERMVNEFMREFRVNYPVALAGEAVTANFGIRSVPVMFVLDRKGKIAEVYRGFTNEVGRSSEQLVKRLLAE